jgi:predicted XRE-type DNA-binding protein
MRAKVTRSSGNTFKDLGFSEREAQGLIVRSDLMIEILKIIKVRSLTQVQAAKLFGVTQPRVSDLARGKIDLFSVDSLINMLSCAGVRVKLVVAPSRRRAGVA